MGHPFTGDLHIALLEYVRLESQGLFSLKSMDFKFFIPFLHIL